MTIFPLWMISTGMMVGVAVADSLLLAVRCAERLYTSNPLSWPWPDRAAVSEMTPLSCPAPDSDAGRV